MRSKTEISEAQAVVGMSTYNGDNAIWVEKAVNSILCQTFTDFIFIIVVDGAIDGEIWTLLKSYAESDKRIVLACSDTNRGLSSSMNFAIEYGLQFEPNVFFRMDSDDISLQDRFQLQMDYFEHHPETTILGTSLVEINEDGNKVGKRNLPLTNESIVKIFPRRCAINHPTVAIKYTVFNKGFRYKEELMNTQDYFLWAELSAAHFSFANLPQPLLQFRRVNDFYKRRGFSKSINEFRARFYMMKVLKKYNLKNLIYAFAVLFLRLMPAKLVKLAYRLDRYLLNKRVRHE